LSTEAFFDRRNEVKVVAKVDCLLSSDYSYCSLIR
jgi:hypothetical protein